MTALEACGLVVNLTGQLRIAHANQHTWQTLALAAFAHCTELRRQLEMVDERQYIHRTRTQDARDLSLDQRDLCRSEAA